LAVILLGKPLAALVIVRLLKYPLRVAISIAIALAQIGEFSFILAQAGKSLGLLDDRATNTLIAAAIASISLNPIVYRLNSPIEAFLKRFLKTPAAPARDDPRVEHSPGGEDKSERDRTIIVGHGPVGQTLARLLIENRVEPVVIELNLETVRKLGIEGIRAVYGDATHRETLEQAGARDAVGLVLSSTNMDRCAETIRLARQLNPTILIVARSNYLRELPALRDAGADIVFSGEGEVALAMTEFLLRQLGATAEQIDRERERIRSDLFGSPAVEATENHS
jgi:CPA2 family monovalent cation:H+ antiporter-2